MGKSHSLAAEAQQDLHEIWYYISQDNPHAALRVQNELRLAFNKLAENPYMGHKREDLTVKSVRFWPVRKYMIIYKPETDPLYIARILSSFRDIREII